MSSTATAKRQPGRARRAGGTLARREARTGFALVSPTLLIVVVMVVLPVLWTIMLALQHVRLSGIRDVNLLTGPYTLRNFDLVLGSDEFWTVLKTTLVYTVGGTVSSIVLGLAAALLVRSAFPGRGLVRAVMLLPWVAPVVAVTFAWQVLLSPQFGFVNAFGTEHLSWNQPIPFLSQEHGELSLLGLHVTVPTALLVVIAFEAWRYFPFAFLFILARLQALPSDVDEAARVDGATPLQIFRHITLPQLGSVLALLTVLRFIVTFNKFDDVYLLTGGGAGTQVLPVQVFDFLTARNDIGSSAAVGVAMALVISLFLGVYLRFFATRMEAEA